ncbi:hypothetical protein HanIR_Chr03g0146921 [Helianthus annuus]|nr:hypothetical protein HanIR_Chr03g0146921 [Helianthus annuus]
MLLLQTGSLNRFKDFKKEYTGAREAVQVRDMDSITSLKLTKTIGGLIFRAATTVVKVHPTTFHTTRKVTMFNTLFRHKCITN